MWLTDRSRYVTGFECPRRRYLKYHSGDSGYGISRKRTYVPLATGTFVHAGLEQILRKGPDRAGVREIISTQAGNYAKLVESRPLNGYDPQEQEFIAQEQSVLIQGMIWAWYRVMYPIIQKEFEIVAIEQEEQFVAGCSCGRGIHPSGHLEACSGIMEMSRPDCILRRKEDGRLGTHDFKTASSVSDAWIEEWRTSIQMLVGSVGAELRLGEDINHFYMHGLLKGSRGFFKKGGENLPYKRQYSHLCYAKITPPSPPAKRGTTWSTAGYWADKLPLWRADFVQKPPEMSIPEFWVMECLAKEQLDDCFILVGPYERDRSMVETFCREMVAEEERWVRNLWTVYGAKESKEDVESTLDRIFPRSYKCTSYSSTCEFNDICFYRTGWRDPIGSGLYEQRLPHHTPEAEQAKSRGIDLPLQPWEEE